MAKFLDQTGVSYLWSKIKLKFVAKDGSKQLSDENFTTALKNKLDGLNNYSLPDATTAVKGGVIVGDGLEVASGKISTKIRVIKLNGSAIDPVSGVIDLGSIASSTALEELTTKVTTIEGNYINKTTLATSSGQATDNTMSQKAITDFVNNSVQTGSAHYLTKDAEGNVFATKAELTGAATFYYGKTAHTPHDHDYVFVQKDESQDGYATRYVYSGGNWVLQYRVNEEPLTAAQLNAINSGITAEKVSKYDGYESQINGKFNASDVAQETGESTSKVISQKVITDELNKKAGKATTLAGYGITDANISGRTITLGSQTIDVPNEVAVDEAITEEELQDILV